MEGNLVIVESPAKAKTIQKFLGEDFIVKSSFGHIRDLQEKNLSVNIEGGFLPEYEIPASKKKIVSELKSLAKKAGTVWLASDEDREGEAISWHLADTLGLDMSKTKRIAFHEITKDAILKAIENPRTIDMNMVNAQQARRVLDRLVGFELSPILWRKIKRGLSAGRVQSVALRLIVDKEREIMAFNPEMYYKVEGIFDFSGTKVKGNLDRRFSSLDEAKSFLSDCIGANYSVTDIEKKEGTRHPAAPFTTSTLQQEAGRKLHFSVSQTMRLAQGLYERGIITYMRTDSTNLSSLALNTAKAYITENYGAEYSQVRQYKTKSKSAQEAHEAIRPTFIGNTEIEGTPQEQKLYSLIWKRTVASQMSSATVMNTGITVSIDKRSEKYSIQAAEVKFDGFLKLYIEGADDEEDSAQEAVLPPVSVGDILTAVSVNADCKYTQAPYRYSEPSLVKKLEELEIGRPSTYATIISTLTTGRGYVIKGDKEGKKVTVTNLSIVGDRISENEKTETVGAERGKLLPADIGMIVSDYLTGNFPDIMDYDFTANVEKHFDDIAAGRLVWNKAIADFYSPFHTKVDEALSDRQFNHVERELGTDPSDGSRIVARFGQYGPYIQKGEGENKQFASLGKGQLIENITLEEALKLFQLPRSLGDKNGTEIVVTKGRFGPYIKFGDKNISLPRGTDPLSITREKCEEFIRNSEQIPTTSVIKEFAGNDISVMKGKYGPYIKHNGSNYKLPQGVIPENLTEEECVKIIEEGAPTSRKFRKFKK